MITRAVAFLLTLSLAAFLGCTGALPFTPETNLQPTLQTTRGRTAPISPSATVASPTSAAQSPGGSTIQIVAMYGKLLGSPTPATTVTIRMTFEPSSWRRGTTSGGSGYTSRSLLAQHTVREMRVCSAVGNKCTPGGAWTSFEGEVDFPFTIDWLGDRHVWIGAEFRDANGALVPVESDRPDELEDHGERSFVITSILDERTPRAAQPRYAQTAVAATRAAYPITGSVEINDGMCCAGGKVGSVANLQVKFRANSPSAPVTEMRVRNACVTEIEMSGAAWEPFVSEKTFPIKITVANWVGWYIAVQFRDANGNLSPVYCDDISVEGMP